MHINNYLLLTLYMEVWDRLLALFWM